MSLDELPTVRGVPSVTAKQMAEVDRVTIEEIAISVDALMENAAHQIARAARALVGRVDGKRIVGLVGRGNNGGDAAGALRHLAGWGAEVRAEVAAFPDDVRETTARQLISLLQIGPSVVRYANPEAPRGPLPNAGAARLQRPRRAARPDRRPHPRRELVSNSDPRGRHPLGP